MPDPSQDKSTYNEEMRRWMAKQSFWHRLKYGRHPGNHSRLFVFFLKMTFIFMVLAAFAVTGYVMAMKKRVGSEEFSKDFSSAAADSLGARTFKSSSVSWGSGVARVSSLRIHGGRSNFFSMLEIDRVSFPLEFSEVMKGEWQIDTIEGRGAEVNLRSGAFTDREWQELIVTNDVEQQKAKNGWMSPVVNIEDLHHIEVRDVNLNWGAKAWMKGSLVGCELKATKNDSGWRLEFTKGKYSQNWIKDVDIEKLVLEVDSTEIRVVEGKLRMRSGAAATVSGNVLLGDDPEFNLSLRVSDLQLNDVISVEEAIFLTGVFDAEVSFTGSLNRREGLSSKGRLVAEAVPGESDDSVSRDRSWLVRLGRSMDAELSVFRAFGDALGVDEVRYFTAESSVIDFETSMGNLEVTEMKLRDPSVGQLSSGFLFDGMTRTIAEGSVTITLKDSVFENNRQLRESRSTLFTEGVNGVYHCTIELMGRIDELTKSDAHRVFEVSRMGD